MSEQVRAFLQDRRGVVPIEYLHVATLTVAAFVTLVHSVYT